MTLADIHPDAFYRVHVVAELFDVCDDTVYGMASKGIIRATRLGPNGGLLRFRGADIIEVATQRAA